MYTSKQNAPSLSSLIACDGNGRIYRDPVVLFFSFVFTNFITSGTMNPRQDYGGRQKAGVEEDGPLQPIETGPEPSPRIPPEPEQLAQPTTGMSSTAPESGTRMFLFENLPHGISEDDGDDASSILSLPNVPSPMSGPSPSILTGNNSREMTGQQHGDTGGPRRATSVSRSRYRNSNNNDDDDDEEDTFYDAGSLQDRIQRTLSHAPQPLHLMETPSSIPVTPGPMSTRSRAKNTTTAAKTPWNQPNFHFQNLSEKETSFHDNNNSDSNMQSHKSAMAIMKLKQDLRNAVNNLYLYKQEKENAEAKAKQLKQQNEQLLQQQKDVQEQSKAMEQERHSMRHSKEELKACQGQLETRIDEKNQMALQVQQLKQDKEIAEKENEELANRIRTVLREHQEDLKSFGENTDARVSRLRGELEAANQEIESLKSSLQEAKSKESDAVKELEEEKEKANSELITMTEKHDACLQEIDRLENVIQAAKDKSEKHIQTLEKDRQELQEKHKADQEEICRLEKALNEKCRQDTAGNIVDDHSTQHAEEGASSTTLKEIGATLVNREEELEMIKTENEIQSKDIEKLVAEVGRLRKDRDGLKSAACQTDIETLTSLRNISPCIQDRLLRIRDASDRVTLVKEHQNEIGRLKAQYDAKIKDLTSIHEDTLQERLDEATTRLEAEHKEAMQKLQSDLESKVSSLERRHCQEVERLKEKMKTSTQISDESLQVAMSKANSFKQRLDRETAKREQLQQEIHNLNEQLTSEHERLTNEHVTELESLKRKWKEEKNILLNVIQRDCNLVFEQNRNKSNMSPKSVVCAFDIDKEFDLSQLESGDPCQQTHSGSSPRYADIDKELQETEALVQRLLEQKSEATS